MEECPRCGGLMVFESYQTRWEHLVWDHFVRGEAAVCWRCVICGEIWDPVIESNRASSQPAHEVYAQMK
jgi:hypothetical protein